MGMFDWVRCSYPLDEHSNCMMQTKDLENLLHLYWISPKGELFLVDESRAFQMNYEKNEENPLLSFKWEPTGLRGKVKPIKTLRRITIYPAEWVGNHDDWPEYKLDFLYGKVISVTKTTLKEGKKIDEEYYSMY